MATQPVQPAHQEPLPDTAVPYLPRRWCRRCGAVLRDPVSRQRLLGPECDPERRIGHRRHDVDQDPIPGL
ncbi:DUF6011 domain-containing protein [Streptomyces sp. NPDC014870]|uniref:DUF6011 domain-containing protein n=1 Tax=Streptomyces sp. NPDC014870 TaxID=3364925 RepID=UPI0037021C4A